MGRTIADNTDAVDFTFSGPALKTFPEFIRLTLEKDEEGRHRIDGVFSRRNTVREGKHATLRIGGLAAAAKPDVALVGV